jgi:hypothetical protein
MYCPAEVTYNYVPVQVPAHRVECFLDRGHAQRPNDARVNDVVEDRYMTTTLLIIACVPRSTSDHTSGSAS